MKNPGPRVNVGGAELFLVESRPHSSGNETTVTRGRRLFMSFLPPVRSPKTVHSHIPVARGPRKARRDDTYTGPRPGGASAADSSCAGARLPSIHGNRSTYAHPRHTAMAVVSPLRPRDSHARAAPPIIQGSILSGRPRSTPQDSPSNSRQRGVFSTLREATTLTPRASLWRGPANAVGPSPPHQRGSQQSPDWRGSGGTVALTLPPRPPTRTLQCSELRARGFELPCIPPSGEARRPGADQSTETPQPVVVMREEWARDCHGNPVAVHLSFFHSPGPAAAAVLRPRLGPPTLAEEGRPRERGGGEDRAAGASLSGLPGVTCYVCGRRFGRSSIGIHEPQCLTRWQAENRKLPIRERKPLPKRPVTRAQMVSAHDLRRVSGHSTAVGVSSGGPPVGVLSNAPPEIPDEAIEQYFQNAYAQFEKELKPCGKCGRSFAPERWVHHVGKCNATPLHKRAVHGRHTYHHGNRHKHPTCD